MARLKKIKEVNGLYYITGLKLPNNIIEELDKNKWKPVSPNNPNSRMIQHYGYKYGYKSYNINELAEPIPIFLESLQKKLSKIVQLKKLAPESYLFNQCIVNNYKGNQGIGRHIDVKSYGDVIGCYTFGSGATMTFTRDGKTVDLYVEPNTLYIMSGDARYKWTHEMRQRLSDKVNGEKIMRGRRVSVTFRNVP